jgi:hypothetical protein
MEGIRRVLELSGKWGPEGTELTDADKYIDLLPGQVWPVRAARTSAAAQETGASQGSRGERGFVATRVGAGGSLRRAALYPAELRVPRASHVAHRGRRFNARAGVEWPCRDLEAIGDSASMLQRQNVCAKSPAAELTGSNPVRCARADGVADLPARPITAAGAILRPALKLAALPRSDSDGQELDLSQGSHPLESGICIPIRIATRPLLEVGRLRCGPSSRSSVSSR